MHVLVTGAAGFVGSHTVDRLVERGHEVTAVDSLDPQVHGPDAKLARHIQTHVDARAIHFHRSDVRDRAAMAPLLERADAVLHLAAAVGVGQSMYQPHGYCDSNVGGTAMLMDLLANAKSRRVRKIVVASSMSNYGEGAYRCSTCGPAEAGVRSDARLKAQDWEHPCPTCARPLEPLPTSESKALRSTSIYALTKKFQEESLAVFGAAYRIPVVALRYFNIYGSRQALANPYTGVAAIFLARLLNGKPPVVFEDGRQSRDFIHVHDIARANVMALEHELDGQQVWNVGTGKATTVLDVARALARGIGSNLEPALELRFRSGDIRHCFADASRIERELGFRAEIGLDAGMRELIEWSRGESPEDHFAESLEALRARRLVQ